MEGATYYVTWSLLPGLPKLSPEERDIIVCSIRHFNLDRYDLSAFVVMDDHVHVLFALRDDWQPNQIIASWKKFTANQLQRQFGRHGRIWREEYFDRIVRDETEFIQKAEYIITNPQRRWPEVSEYLWVWHVGMEESGIRKKSVDGYGDPSS